jgi:hypothetical protein
MTQDGSTKDKREPRVIFLFLAVLATILAASDLAFGEYFDIPLSLSWALIFAFLAQRPRFAEAYGRTASRIVIAVLLVLMLAAYFLKVANRFDADQPSSRDEQTQDASVRRILSSPRHVASS